MREEFGAREVYVRSPAAEGRQERAASLLALFNGRNATEVARRPFSPLPPERAPEVSLPDVLIRLAQDSAGTLDDRLITVTGFVTRTDGQLDLGRVVIICCAADASLARIHLSGPAAAEAARYPDDTWLRVEGRVAGHSTLEIVSATRIEAPANTYAY